MKFRKKKCDQDRAYSRKWKRYYKVTSSDDNGVIFFSLKCCFPNNKNVTLLT